MTTTGKDKGPHRAAGGARRRGRGSSVLPSERREHLVRLAAELFAEKGYQATTVRNIADEAGILSGSLYHHFDSKESIVDEILTAFFDELAAANQAVLEKGGDPRTILAGLVGICFGTLVPHRAAIMVLQNDWNYLRQFDRFDYLSKSEEVAERLWVGQLVEGQRTGLFRDDIDARLTYRMIRDTIWVAVRWFRPGGRLDAQGLADHYIKVLFDGIAVH
ncbi:TetR/AcrR family transcriptional regulator [Actinomadura sp. DC4]|uniref:TetR/AcrR family transcriptional regulator n=1 Tax=Actinomadura sp. DC4 TaxID=3055069 RepID=UPI0025B2111F|nr:TetR/AcrR family transcriptional regulator [Actinomadura sp. DC4]MDN3356528.1 TetR/AcrR family transcriptional regulator [Actinomadura sp. DC4]